ncbi:MAG: serine hydrolase domain-containing protein [Sphingomonas sp.]|jgi:methyl acetate hydrolase
MKSGFKNAADAILRGATQSGGHVPGVVAMVTDRKADIYAGASGKRRVDAAADIAPDDHFALFSTTKAITGTAVLQLVERGMLDLDAPARDYAPAIGELQVIEGFDTGGSPILRAPKRDITTRMLMTHTAGLGYHFFNKAYFRLVEQGLPTVVSGTRRSLMTPLLFDPGDAWEYGSSLDWCGQIVEHLTGHRLGDVFREEIFAPLGITTMTFEVDDKVERTLASIHARNADGSLTPLDLRLPANPEVHMGGHGLYGTVPDYMRFIRMWLNDGMGEHGRVLKPETVRMAEKNQLGDMKIGMLPGIDRTLSNDAEFFPGLPKSWSFSFMVNDATAPTGRPAGALGWAGLANLFYWIDRKNGYGGFWATQILPFGDPVSFGRYLEFETAFYDHLD